MVDYFLGVFTSLGSEASEVLNTVRPRVTHEQNSFLLHPFEAVEIKEVLFSMYPEKFPCLDGLNPGFYQAYYDIVDSEVTRACLESLKGGLIPEELNMTSIVLIPKKGNPEKVLNLRPIALCNVLYMVMSKVIANSRKLVLPTVVSDSHSAFIPSRLIIYNIMVAFEVCHYLNIKR